VWPQNLKAIITHDSVTLLESNSDYVQEFIAELQVRVHGGAIHVLNGCGLCVVFQRVVCEEREMPFEFIAMEAMLIKKVRELFPIQSWGI